MKKLFYIAAALFALVSCNKEAASVAEEVTFTVDVNMPGEVSTKTIADGLTATKLYYEVWSADKETRFYKGTAVLDERKTRVEFNLVKNQTYNILFWAQNPTVDFYGVDDADDADGLSVITMNYSGTPATGTTPATGVVANDESRDAFYNNELQDILVTGPMTKDITLVRPFAQVNFGTTAADVEAASLIGGMYPTRSKVTFSVALPTVLDLFTGEVSGEQTIVYDYTAFPDPATDGYLEVDTDGDGEDEQYLYLSMNYVLVNQTESMTADVTANVEIFSSVDMDEEGDHVQQNDVVVKVSSAPLKRNFRTNIIGDLLTAPSVFNIVIDQYFDPADENLTPDPAQSETENENESESESNNE